MNHAPAAPESVWDYPRPPRLEPTSRTICIVHAGITIAATTRAVRILETSHPPVYYLPPADLNLACLRASQRRSSFCEFKGTATYWSLDLTSAGIDVKVPDVAWSYHAPATQYAALKDHLAFYASRLETCTVDGEPAVAQPGDFYGGWITSHVNGPFKGAPGTLGW